MTLTELAGALGIQNGTISSGSITISTGTFDANIDELLEYCYSNQPIVISQASTPSTDNNHQLIQVSGKSSFAGVSDLDVNASFSLDDEGNVQMQLDYELIGERPKANAWNFSRSFPDLPKVLKLDEIGYDMQTGLKTETKIVPLDELYLFNSRFVVTSAPGTDTVLGTPLQWGINFCGNVRTDGMLGIIENIFQYTDQLKIYGTIRLPLPTETPKHMASLIPESPERFIYPWDIEQEFTKGIPGILLTIDLDLSYEIGNDSVQFSGKSLKMYSPLEEKWILGQTNPQIVPISAYTGELDIPSAAITVDVICPNSIGLDTLTIIGNFKGVSVGKLDHLVGLIGWGDPPRTLIPDPIARQIDSIELTQAEVTIDYTDLSDISISNCSFTVGIPDLKWEVWPGVFEVDNILCQFNIDHPFQVELELATPQQRTLDITVFGTLEIGNVPFKVYASKGDNFTVYAEMAKGQTIPLKAILKEYAPTLSPPSDLTIDLFRAGISPAQGYSFAMAMMDEPNPMTIDLGPTQLKVEDLSMGFVYDKDGGASGSVSGTIQIGNDFKLAMTYDSPGNIVMRSMIRETTTSKIIGLLTNQAMHIPGAFDLTLTNNSVLIQEQGGQFDFELATEVQGVGTLALQIRETGGMWGAAYGIDMPTGLPSSLPGLSFLKKFEAIFPLSKFMIVASSFDGPNLQFPDMAAFNNPRINAKKVQLPSQASTLVAGLNVYAQWDLNDKNKEQHLLHKFLGLPLSMDITLQVGEDPAEFSKLFYGFDTTVSGHAIKGQLGGMIQDGEIALFMTGIMDFNIQGSQQVFDVTLLFVPNGAFISASMTGAKPIDFTVFKLGNLALEIGIDWEGLPSLGIAASIDVGDFESSVAIFFDSADPAKSLVAGAVSNLTMKNVFDTFTPGLDLPQVLSGVLDKVGIKGTNSFTMPTSVAKVLDNRDLSGIAQALAQSGNLIVPSSQQQVLFVVNDPGKSWHLTDMTNMHHYEISLTGSTITVITEAQFYCSPEDTMVGAVPYREGFYINGMLDFFGFEAEMTLTMNVHQGMALDATMDKIVLGSETLFSIIADEGSGGPVVSAATFFQPQEKNKLFRPPHMYINGKIETLGLSHSSFVSITEDGMVFDLNGDLIPGINFDLSGHFDSFTNLNVAGKVTIGIGKIDLGPLGTINIGTGCDGQLSIGVNGNDLYANIDAGFEFAGHTHSLGSIDLDVTTNALEHLVGTLTHEVTEELKKLLTDPKEWANLVKKGVITGVKDMQKVLTKTFGLAEGAAKDIMGGAEKVCSATTAAVAMTAKHVVSSTSSTTVTGPPPGGGLMMGPPPEDM